MKFSKEQHIQLLILKNTNISVFFSFSIIKKKIVYEINVHTQPIVMQQNER